MVKTAEADAQIKAHLEVLQGLCDPALKLLLLEIKND
jgi:hypothetical protein